MGDPLLVTKPHFGSVDSSQTHPQGVVPRHKTKKFSGETSQIHYEISWFCHKMNGFIRRFPKNWPCQVLCGVAMPAKGTKRASGGGGAAKKAARKDAPLPPVAADSLAMPHMREFEKWFLV